MKTKTILHYPNTHLGSMSITVYKLTFTLNGYKNMSLFMYN